MLTRLFSDVRHILCPVCLEMLLAVILNSEETALVAPVPILDYVEPFGTALDWPLKEEVIEPVK